MVLEEPKGKNYQSYCWSHLLQISKFLIKMSADWWKLWYGKLLLGMVIASINFWQKIMQGRKDWLPKPCSAVFCLGECSWQSDKDSPVAGDSQYTLDTGAGKGIHHQHGQGRPEHAPGGGELVCPGGEVWKQVRENGKMWYRNNSFSKILRW